MEIYVSVYRSVKWVVGAESVHVPNDLSDWEPNNQSFSFLSNLRKLNDYNHWSDEAMFGL